MKLGSMVGLVAVASCRGSANLAARMAAAVPGDRAAVALAGTPPGQVSRNPATSAPATAPIRPDRPRADDSSVKLVVQAERMPRRIEEHADVFLRLILGEGRAEVHGVGHGTGQVLYRGSPA